MKRSVIDTVDLSKEEVQGLLDTAMDIIADPAKYAHACAGKKLATLFFEPSTRTRMSFEAAMYELGGNVISMTDAGTSSATKGETVADTVKVVSNYVDIIAQRHPKAGAALVSAVNAQIPVINAGDGGHCHPTQTFADLLTIYREYGKMDGLTIGFCGDLLYGRTVHSLMSAMARYEDTKFVLISPDELKVPRHLIDDVVTPNSIPCEETASLEDALPLRRYRTVRAAEELLRAGRGKDEAGKTGLHRDAPAAPGGRDRGGSGRRSQGPLFRTDL